MRQETRSQFGVGFADFEDKGLAIGIGVLAQTVSFQPIRVFAKKIDSIARDDSFLIGCVPAGGVIPKAGSVVASAIARALIWVIVMHVRGRRGHFQRDASLFFHALPQNDRADPLEVLTPLTRVAEQPASQTRCGQICLTNLNGDFDLSDPTPPAVCGLPGGGCAALREISNFSLTKMNKINNLRSTINRRKHTGVAGVLGKKKHASRVCAGFAARGCSRCSAMQHFT